MFYVESVRYSLLINGDQVWYIKPSRGLRQGDPLSPYLFIMCTEGLIALLWGAISRGELNGIKLGPELQPLSHFMFADDILLLGQAIVSEAQVIRDLLSNYELWYGQLVNGSGTDKKIHWIAWEQLCKSKEEGGLGFRRTQDFNQALLCKQAWRLITGPNCQLSRTLNARYYPDGDFFSAKLGSGPSFTWRSLLSIRDLLNNGIEWKLGRGQSINICQHKWVHHTHTNKVITPMDQDFKDLRVSDLIDPEVGVWDFIKVNTIFYQVDCEAIL
ncbi:hypothetical protein LIER_38092 [Lithospermum erythrorhizon]|uniref:Reverse transcriptase domain-containing protein n=1 Tax=Lithospermum erythrorhizon TaxID=34254 RepID=A0AAV3PVD5_LITER